MNIWRNPSREWNYWYSDIGSWLCFPSQEQLKIIPEQDSTEKTLEYGNESEANPYTTEAKTDCIRKVRRVDPQWPPHPPVGWYNTTPRSLPWASASANGKREYRVDIHLLQYCRLFLRSSYSCLTHAGYWGICRVDYWESHCDGDKGGASNNKYSGLGIPSCSPSQGFCLSTKPRQ